MQEKKSFKVSDNAFISEVYSRYNGTVVKQVLDSDGSPSIGRSGETKAYDTSNGGRLFLHDNQVTEV